MNNYLSKIKNIIQEIFDPEDSKNTSENNSESILKQVEKIKRIARENKIDDKIAELYNKTVHYPSWLSYGNENTHCSLIEEARDIPLNEDEDIDNNKYYLKLKSGNTFTFNLKNIFDNPCDGEFNQFADLELLFNQKRVAQISVSDSDYDAIWRACDIKAYIDGEWVAIVEDLLRTIEDEKKERAKAEQEDQKNIDKLKSDFGIE